MVHFTPLRDSHESFIAKAIYRMSYVIYPKASISLGTLLVAMKLETLTRFFNGKALVYALVIKLFNFQKTESGATAL